MQESWQALAAAYEAAGFPLDAARTRIWQLRYLNIVGDTPAALALAQQLAPLVQAHGSVSDGAYLLHAMAVAHGNAGALDTANHLIDQAIDRFAHLRCPLEQATCWLRRSFIHQRREQFGAALADLERALVLFRRRDLPLQAALAEKEKGLVFSRLGHYDQAVAATLRARAQLGALQRRDQVAHCDMNLGVIFHYSGMFDLAMALYRRVQSEYAALGLRSKLLASQRNQAMVLRLQGKPAEALQLLATLEREVRALDDTLELLEVLQEQALGHCDLGDYAAALALLEQVQQQFAMLGNMPAAAESMLEQGWLLLRQHNPVAAETALTSAGASLDDRPIHTWRIAYGLGRCAQMRGNAATALAYYQNASTTVAALRRTIASEHASSSLFSQAQQLYTDALRLAADTEDVLAALALVEQHRALVLQRQMQAETLHLPPQLQAAYEQHHAHLVRLMSEPAADQELAAALATYTDLLLRVRHTEPLPDDVATTALDLAELRQHFSRAYPTGWLALIYAHCGSELLIITLEPHTLSLTRRPFDAALQRLLERTCTERYRRLIYLDSQRLRDPSRPPWAELQQLATHLLPAAVQERLRPDLRLLIVPDGALHAVAWAALRLKSGWLCQHALIQIVPALASWATLAARPVAADSAALLLGCGEFGERAPPLPNVSAQLDMIAAQWPGAVTRLENEAATRSALLDMAAEGTLSRYTVLHLASHAQMLAAHGLLARLRLWDDDLLLDEVLRLQLQGAVVVLAACESGASEVLPGEEVLSLSRAFLAAGARDVVASLWTTYDLAVQALLQPFYQALAQGAAAPEALALAQRRLAEQYTRDEARNPTQALASSPLVWGSFTVVGVGVV
jgi:CHAT domain-containing protein